MQRAESSPGVFLSYRRSDTEGYAGRLFEGLVARFGRDRVFFDVARIAPGQNFHAVIDDQLRASGTLLALIGRTWATATDDDGRRRLDDPDDSVRVEIRGALERGIPIIPVLVQGAFMPRSEDVPAELRPLTAINAIELRHTRWDADFAGLIEALETHVTPAPAKRRRRPRWLVPAIVGVALLALIAWLMRVDVPDVVGLPIEAARAVLTATPLGVRVTEGDVLAARVALAPRVLEQRPAPGAVTWRGRRVDLTVSKLGVPPSLAPASAERDAVFARAVIGTWRARRTVLNAAFLDLQGTYLPGGKASWLGNIVYQWQRTPVVLTGTWKVEGGEFHTRVDSSSAPQLVPSGYSGVAKIIGITTEEFGYIDPADGKTYVDLRVK